MSPNLKPNALLQAVLVDDEPDARVALRELLHRISPPVTVLAEAENLAQAEQVIRATAPELVFLDIRLQGRLGFEVLEAFPNPNFAVIFATAYDTYALQAFEAAAVDYLVKPIAPEALQRAVVRATEALQNQRARQQLLALQQHWAPAPPARIALQMQAVTRFVRPEDVLALHAQGSYTAVRLLGQDPLLVSLPLVKLLDSFPQPPFIRVHRSHAVNQAHVLEYRRLEGWELLLSDATPVPVSKPYRTAVKKAFGITA